MAAIIPARYASTRLPGKPLADIGGRPMVWRVYEQASKAKLVNKVWVATDDQRVYDAVAALGGNAVLTSPDHLSGTDRLAEAAEKIQADIYVNVQGDEPLIPPELIDEAVKPMLEDEKVRMATAAIEINDPVEISDPSVVKVVLDEKGDALYFSRAPIPFHRDSWGGLDGITAGPCLKHVGLYVYRREFLLKYSKMEPTLLEQTEKLEQLRALGNGEKIRVVITNRKSIGVDTPEDLNRVRKIFSEGEKG